MIYIVIAFVIISIILKLWKNYLCNDIQANIKYHIKGGSFTLAILTIFEYILGAIILVKIILKIIM